MALIGAIQRAPFPFCIIRVEFREAGAELKGWDWYVLRGVQRGRGRQMNQDLGL